jgi:hypothetical protein
LKTYQPEPLPEEVLVKLNQIAERAGKDLAKVQFVS